MFRRKAHKVRSPSRNDVKAPLCDVAEPGRGMVPRGMLELRSLLCWGCFALSLVGCSYPELPRLTDADAPPADGTFPSCQGLPKTCGINSDDDCCASPEVQGGRFSRGYDLAGDSTSGLPNFPAIISSFRLDKYEVTVGRFRSFVAAGYGTQDRPPAAGSGAHANVAGSGWNESWNVNLRRSTSALMSAVKCSTPFTWTDDPGDNETRPMNCISWYEAMAFCIWDRGFLPTENEWNYAASAGSQQRAYPWSSPPGSVGLDPTRASYHDGTTCVGDGLVGCAITDLLRVGSKPAGNGFGGHSDLGGNVSEWTLDEWAEYSNPCEDCANIPPNPGLQVFRGGNYREDASYMRAGIRFYLAPHAAGDDIGVRCARPVTDAS